MDGACSQQNKAISRKRKRKMKGIDDDLSANKQNARDNIGVGKLPDDLLIAILSRMSLKEAVRTSVLSHRWKYLWMFAFGTLEFNGRNIATGTVMKRKKFESWVNAVLKFHQPRHIIDGLIICFSKIRREGFPISERTYHAIDNWISFAVQKEVQRFELNFAPLGEYEFPNIDKLLSISHEIKSPFHTLRSLRLLYVDIEDEVVHYFLASCPHLEELRIRASYVTKNLQVVDPPNLKVLEISKCHEIQSLEISSPKVLSFTYAGKKIGLSFKKLPNLSELTLGNDLCDSFIFEPNEHSSYSVQLMKLVLNVVETRYDRATIAPPPDLPQLCFLKQLELQIFSLVGRSLLFFTSLIKASPHLHKFRIEIIYAVDLGQMIREIIPFPAVSSEEAVKFDHKDLKVVEMVGFVGCSSEEKFLRQLFKIAPSLAMVVIDTESEYYDDPQLASVLKFRRNLEIKYGLPDTREIGATTRAESREYAEHLISSFPQEIKFIVK